MAPQTAADASTLQEETEELFQRNMDLFQRCWPDIHQRLVAVERSHAKLVRVDEDDWDLEFRGERFYGQGARKFAAEQVEQYWQHRRRIMMSPPTSKSMERHANQFLVEYVRRATEELSATFNYSPQFEESYHLIVFGIGLGFHLPDLIRRAKSQFVLICEPNINIVYHSLRCFDWSELLENPPHRPLTLTWLIYDDPDKLSYLISDHLRLRSVCRIDGTYWFQHYPNSVLTQAREKMERNIGLAYSGLGYLDDDLKMIRNAHQNLQDDKALVFQHGAPKRNWPVFIVGSGPSLEKNFEDIRRNRDNAIIIACGTALSPLMAEGIKPDFFVELENGEPIYDWIYEASQRFDLSGITMLASDTVDGRLRSLFDRTLFFLRPGLSSTYIFGTDEKNILNHVFPTVGNTALAFSIYSGFSEIYFFGLDLGSKQEGRHHASETPYGKVEGLPTDVPLDKQHKGNFGGTVRTDYVFNWGRDVVERLLAMEGRGKRVFNCSDGAQIRGATPKAGKAVKLRTPSNSREDELNSLFSRLSPYGMDRFEDAWKTANAAKRFADMRDELLRLCVVQDDREDYLGFLDDLTKVLIPAEQATTHVGHTAYRGTMMMAMIAGAYYITHVNEVDKRRQVAELCAEELRDLINRMGDLMADFVTTMEESGYYELPIW